nr:GGDEF domain-containing protein [Rhizobium halophytocola]
MSDRTSSELARLARIDPLTGALNRRGFEQGFNQTKAENPAALVSIVLFGIDHFKVVNDTYGHAAGDLVLKQFTAICRRLLPPDTPFGRTGGAEFAFAMPQQDIRDATRHAEAIRRAFAAVRIEADQAAIQVTTSAGVVTTPAQMASFDRSLTLADKALYLAKARGRNRVVVWNEDENAQVGEQARMIDDNADRQVAVLQRITAVNQPHS